MYCWMPVFFAELSLNPLLIQDKPRQVGRNNSKQTKMFEEMSEEIFYMFETNLLYCVTNNGTCCIYCFDILLPKTSQVLP